MTYFRFGIRDSLWAMVVLAPFSATAEEPQSFKQRMHSSVGKSVRLQGIVGVRKGALLRLTNGGEVQLQSSDPKEVHRELGVIGTHAGKLVAVYGIVKYEAAWNPPPSKGRIIAGHDEYFWVDLSDRRTRIVQLREF